MQTFLNQTALAIKYIMEYSVNTLARIGKLLLPAIIGLVVLLPGCNQSAETSELDTNTATIRAIEGTEEHEPTDYAQIAVTPAPVHVVTEISEADISTATATATEAIEDRETADAAQIVATPTTKSESEPTQTRLMMEPEICNTTLADDDATHLLAFAADWDGDLEIYTISLLGNNLQQHTDNETYERDPRWSPDGRSLLFSSGIDFYGSSSLIAIDPTTSRETFRLDGRIYTYVWSLDSSRIFYIDDIHKSLAVHNVWSHEDVTITALERFTAFGGLTIASDNSTLAFWATADSNQAFPLIVAYDTTGLSTIDETERVFGHNVEFSPTSNQIMVNAYVPPSGQVNRLLLIDLDTRLLSILAETNDFLSDVTWNPLGSNVAYVAHNTSVGESERQMRIELLDVLTGETSILLESEDVVIQGLQWSESGRYISYIRGVGPYGEDLRWSLEVLDLCTSNSWIVARDIVGLHAAWRPLVEEIDSP